MSSEGPEPTESRPDRLSEDRQLEAQSMIEPIDLSSIAQAVEPDSFSWFCTRLQLAIQALLEQKYEWARMFFRANVSISRQKIYILNTTSTGGAFSEMIRGLSEEEAYAFIDQAVSLVCNFVERPAFEFEARQPVGTDELSGYISEHRERLFDAVQTKPPSWIQSTLRPNKAHDIRNQREKEVNKAALAEIERVHAAEYRTRQRERFEKRLLEPKERQYDLRRNIAILHTESMDQAALRAVYAVVIDSKTLYDNKPRRVSMVARSTPMEPITEIPEGKPPPRADAVILASEKNGVREVEIVVQNPYAKKIRQILKMFHSSEPETVKVHNIRFTLGRLVTHPQSAPDQGWDVDGLHICAEEDEFFFATEVGLRLPGPLVDWIPRSRDADEAEDSGNGTKAG